MLEARSSIRITAEPIDEQRCKFIVNRPVADSEAVHKYTSLDQAGDSPVAQAVLQVPGICEVVLASHVLTAVKDPDLPWSALEPQVRYALTTALEQPRISDAGVGDAVDDDAAYDLVAEIFRTQINPAVAQHGGKVELIDVQEGVVLVRMMGGCQGCGMANVTLQQGIEASLRRAIPSISGIQDITDHAAGTNPYFEAGTK